MAEYCRWTASDESRVASLERTVIRLSEAIGLDVEQQRHTQSEVSVLHQIDKANADQEAPLLVIRDAASESSIHLDPRLGTASIIEKGLVSTDEAKQLLTIFHNHYRRWIALRESGESNSDLSITNSPLLLCACCLIAVRHWSSERARHIVDALFAEVKSLLSQQLLQSPQPLAFFQAVLVLSMWSTTIGQTPLSIDAWLVTGFAIQHASASDVFRESQYSSSLDSEFESTVGKLLLWNRLCLAHLHACISMRRNAMVSKADVERIRKRLPPGELSNFEMRMVAETNLYWALYDNAVASSVNLPQAQAVLQSWKHVWNFLLEQPRSQFLQMGYHFAQLLMFEQCLNNKSAAVRESLLAEMVRLSSAILQLAMETTDERTKHLTDHIYHMIAFAAITLCRLLCKYESQLQTRLDIPDSDTLILNTITWLRSLGSSLHVGHTMGDLIHAAHRKLRPDAHVELRRASEPQQPTPDQAIFPDFMGLGMDTLDIDWDAMLPDWQSLASDELTHAVLPSG